MDITRFLPNNEYQAAIGANNPSASNVFATINDLPAPGAGGIYNGSGSLMAGETGVLMLSDSVLKFN